MATAFACAIIKPLLKDPNTYLLISPNTQVKLTLFKANLLSCARVAYGFFNVMLGAGTFVSGVAFG